ncbi:hypothetical protein [Roseovarius sp. MBR-6]|jgi:hypothetical protein|uniref:hypothetical protein n=1 Tax=Roseovarius sp. MBR-6 TaxID=3156459 RepID=UPI003397842D
MAGQNGQAEAMKIGLDRMKNWRLSDVWKNVEFYTIWKLGLVALAGLTGNAAYAQEMGFLDREALSLGRAIIGLALFSAWFWAGIKAADAGHNWLAWAIGIGPILLFILGLLGAFR